MSVSVKIAIYSISEHLDGKKMSNVVIENLCSKYSDLSNKSEVGTLFPVGKIFSKRIRKTPRLLESSEYLL